MASLHSNIPLPPKLEVHGNLAQSWKKWRQVWDSYEIVAGINVEPVEENADAEAQVIAEREKKKKDKYRLATFITCIGLDALEVYNGLPFETPAGKNDIDTVLQLFDSHCVGETNVIYERYLFNNRNQESDENIDNYASALRTMSQTCEFGVIKDSLIRDRIVCGIRDNNTRKRLLQERRLVLASCIDKCKAAEVADARMKTMAGHDEVNMVRNLTQEGSILRKDYRERLPGTEVNLPGVVQTLTTKKPKS